MSPRLAEKVALVTGAGSGFGAAIASASVAEGADVVVTDLNVTGGEAVASQHANIHFLEMNVAVESDWRKALDFVIDKSRRIDILGNNARTSHRNKPTLEVTKAKFDRCISVNLESIFHSVNVFVPKMIKQGKSGSFVNISSIGSSRPRPGLVWYNASKGAVSNATKGLAAEFDPNQIRFNNPKDVAQAAVYLASDESAFITGINVKVDGGQGI